MNPTPLELSARSLQRISSAVIATLAAISFAWTFYAYSFGLDVPWAGVSQTTLYYTHMATAFIALLFAAAAMGYARASSAATIGHAVITMSILVLHYWFFRGLDNFMVSPLRSKIVHGLLPLLIAAYWIVFVDKRELGWRDPLLWTAFPLAYTIYGLLRGALTGEYAYDVGNVSNRGYAKVLSLVGGTIIFALIVGYLLLAVDKLLSRRWKKGMPAVAQEDGKAMPGTSNSRTPSNL